MLAVEILILTIVLVILLVIAFVSSLVIRLILKLLVRRYGLLVMSNRLMRVVLRIVRLVRHTGKVFVALFIFVAVVSFLFQRLDGFFWLFLIFYRGKRNVWIL